MDEDAIEAVARLICEAAGFDPDNPTCDIYVYGDPDAGKPWAGFRPHARNVIATLEERGWKRENS